MDPTLEERQNNQEQEKKSGGGISQGINALNNLRGLRNLSGKTGLKSAAQVGRLAAQGAARFGAFLFTPTGLVVLTVAIVFIGTVAVIFLLGAPPTQTITPSPTPPPAL
ncbi:MAG: hypothetical protein A3B47_04285 [Candidatus Levybacteria bacterium RIFCSPLOWO2_01_FULL_39_24]|nr:MAG: hypothetical protein A2800_04525 [Candidatus Levybacteria bacterium RIFCSPHIGHO2_01_FULL_40_16]OGH45884.1 MAG: hypothetical protein A3B47_04285 [Candidatus Levybacteria bacterium RIFCSPLOWO2_01_FULL_39_24]